ncbi:head-tail joining protein [Pseudomonas gingeri]|uniref:head-tail joining protein n=1 Tax=Pseudomonas gingeri TaxID=117681 RepID=UPI0015B88E81|nr:hypothetical protein [Pseudomonas gingeri]NWD49024.1 hypothetical protein [Pseudomonas gingeri]
MGGSEFDEAFDDADAELFETFGEKGGGLYEPIAGGQPKNVGAVLLSSVGAVGGSGAFVNVERAVDLRIRQVPEPRRGDILTIGCKRYVLDEFMGADSLINRYSLLPAD